MSRWFRFYDDAINDPKALKLSDRTFRVWVGMLCLASKNGGVLPSFDDMAILLRMKPAQLQPELEKLIAAELLDHDDNGIAPHNWNARQYKSDTKDATNAQRQKRYRDRYRNGDSNGANTVTVTPTRAETEQITDAAPDGAHSDEAELFRRGKQILGKSSGGQISNLLKAKGGSIALARAAIEQASTKENPREYVARVIAGPRNGGGKTDLAQRDWTEFIT